VGSPLQRLQSLPRKKPAESKTSGRALPEVLEVHYKAGKFFFETKGPSDVLTQYIAE